MAYETKAILTALADIACRTGSKAMYKAIAKMANTEGVLMPSYEEAKADIEEDE